jgi:hypothetical protein
MKNVELCGKKHTGDTNLIIRINNSIILQVCCSCSVDFSFSFVSFVLVCANKIGRKFSLLSTPKDRRERNGNDFSKEVDHEAYRYCSLHVWLFNLLSPLRKLRRMVFLWPRVCVCVCLLEILFNQLADFYKIWCGHGAIGCHWRLHHLATF